MVGRDGALPLPWIDAPLREGLQRNGHALLLLGAAGGGVFELTMTLAQAILCEAAASPGSDAIRPCGVCAACRLFEARTHPDLLLLLSDALRVSLGWGGTGTQGEEGESERSSKAKPSKEIKVDAVRTAVSFAQTTPARSRGKVIVVFPAEAMNAIASNALLKTLEEPPGAARFVLGCTRPDVLLPTLRSRCETLTLPLPSLSDAIEWLSRRGVREPEVLLAASGGQPLLALQWAEEGLDAKLWAQVPILVARGEATAFTAWPLPRLVDALQKVCHDALCVAAGAGPRYFPSQPFPPCPDVVALAAWSRRLSVVVRRVEHPWSTGLMIEALIDDARQALSARPRPI